MTPVLICSVTARPSLRGTLYKIVDSEGQHYATRDPWRASLCERARQGGLLVKLWSSAGWHDRNLTQVMLMDDTAVSA